MSPEYKESLGINIWVDPEIHHRQGQGRSKDRWAGAGSQSPWMAGIADESCSKSEFLFLGSMA